MIKKINQTCIDTINIFLEKAREAEEDAAREAAESKIEDKVHNKLTYYFMTIF